MTTTNTTYYRHRIPTLTSQPLALGEALARIDAREHRERQRQRHPGLLQRLFKGRAKRVQTEHTVRLSSGEVIHSNFEV